MKSYISTYLNGGIYVFKAVEDKAATKHAFHRAKLGNNRLLISLFCIETETFLKISEREQDEAKENSSVSCTH